MKLNVEWIPGNHVELIDCGDEYFAAVFKAIDEAEREVLVETFILFEDRVGLELQRRLIDAGRRGVSVDLTVDGFGSPDLSETFISALTAAGVRLHVYEPTPFVRYLNPLRRLHRKIVVVDGRVAFVGGINFSEDHLDCSGAKAKQDYAVRITGPAVEPVRALVRDALAAVRRRLRGQLRGQGSAGAARPAVEQAEAAGSAEVALVCRDNLHHRTDIERAYRMAIRSARDTIVIANAYFFPGYRLVRDLRRAAARGVAVHLILQNNPDVPIARLAGRLLYEGLIKDGVEIHEYCRREMHGKVAVVDSVWTTIGSSNLDPLSLALNLESNVLIRDAEFAATLMRSLQRSMADDCEQARPESLPRQTMWRYLLVSLAYHVVRGFPRWLNALPHFGWRIRSFVRGRSLDTRAAVDASTNPD